ncbi:sulfurtransferase [Dermatophilus congolensis]|uniref:sulfurtransferase n=2 Tax=Dermatophilus congolensis TaxID=1863 RepID=UPI001AAF2C3F|nr:sulfurtransferase [Dermatophilus congolensis]MBO3142693.1 sulfurtransferase [Dermatophilus congolensis]MBO3151685.1 sulfurtransferase [Dermatophilus congolensis]MBO3161315.1 sulfurtransferase [Dermatophilus congolensis]MBO3162966.1 sulfurtransferase [Dermatophilus congolensis]MBO3183283.1 sulfurtransferase [Dermatophilus congolensis]
MHRYPLITASELAEKFHRGAAERPLVLDVRWQLGADDGYDSYLQAHIPGAIFVDLERDLSGTPAPDTGRHPMPRIDDFEIDMAECGVDNDRPVVVYDDFTSFAAARAWWLLRHFGKMDVYVLDGGLSAWRNERLPTEAGIRLIDEGDFSVRRSTLSYLTAETAELYARDGILIDGRAPERFEGRTEPVDTAAGHIPGAVNLPATDLINDEGKLLPADKLLERFAAVGATTETPIATTCGSGVVASFIALAAGAAGLGGQIPVYIGAWSDWISNPERPIATGPAQQTPTDDTGTHPDQHA